MFAFLQNVGPWQLLVCLFVLLVLVGIPVATIVVVLLLVNGGRGKNKAAGSVCQPCGGTVAASAEDRGNRLTSA